jgi:hypothetical protein
MSAAGMIALTTTSILILVCVAIIWVGVVVLVWAVGCMARAGDQALCEHHYVGGTCIHCGHCVVPRDARDEPCEHGPE